VNVASLREDVIDRLDDAVDHVITSVMCNEDRSARASAMDAVIEITVARDALRQMLPRVENANDSGVLPTAGKSTDDHEVTP
jgi:hypothetical protein